MKTFTQFINEAEDEKKDKKKKDLKKEYTKFFDKVLDLYNVSSPEDLSKEDKEDFFNTIALAWDEGEGLNDTGEKIMKGEWKPDLKGDDA